MVHAIRIVLEVGRASSIRTMPYKLKLQFRGISRDIRPGRRSQTCSTTRETTAIPAFLPRHFSARARCILSAFPREGKKRSHSRILPSPCSRYKRNAVVQRWKHADACVLRADVSLAGIRARVRIRARPRSRNVDWSKLYTITNPTRNYHVTSLAHCASGNVKD